MAKSENKAFDQSRYPNWIDPHDVIPYEKNAKVHDPEQVRNIANSIRRFGWQQDTVITRDHVLVIGHGRRLAALERGCMIPYHVVDKDADQLTEEDIRELRRTLRASKCSCEPCPVEMAQDFFVRNHRQSAPNIRKTAVCYALVYRGEIVAVMLYDISNGAVRGRNKDYELVRLAISKGTRIHGGASKLQTQCESTLREMGITKIYSYSNATINSGAVYEKLGFIGTSVDGGQPFVVLNNNKIIRLISLYPKSTDKQLAQHGWIKVHLGGNRTWKKLI